MCGRIELTLTEGMQDTLRTLFQIDPAWPTQPEISPTQEAQFLTHGTAWTVHSGRWGLIPPGMQLPAAKKYATFNARAETMDRSPSFRDAFKSGGRCVLPLSAFFEWPKKSKVRIARPDDKPLLVAGLWSAQPSEDGERLSCTVITRPPTDDLAGVHDRMPALLLTRDLDAWLNAPAPEAKAVALGSWRPGLVAVTPLS